MNYDKIKFLTLNSAMKMIDSFKNWSFFEMLQASHNVLLEGDSPKWVKTPFEGNFLENLSYPFYRQFFV